MPSSALVSVTTGWHIKKIEISKQEIIVRLKNVHWNNIPDTRTSPRSQDEKYERFLTNTIFLAPAVVLLIAYIVYPILNTLFLSFFKWNGLDPIKIFVGFDNWLKLLHDAIFWRSFSNNLQIVFFSIVIQLPLGFIIAVMLTEMKRFSGLLKTVFFFPMLMSSVAIGILFKNILNPNFGIIASLLNLFGLQPIEVLGNPDWALFIVILIICWQYVPFYMVFFLSAVSTISTDIRDYSMIDGASKFQYYTRIVLPMLSGYIRTAIILSMIGSLKYFDLIFVLTNGGPVGSTELMSTYMYKNAFTMFKMGYGSAIAFALFFIVILFSILTQRFSKAITKKWSL